MKSKRIAERYRTITLLSAFVFCMAAAGTEAVVALNLNWFIVNWEFISSLWTVTAALAWFTIILDNILLGED